MATFTLTAATSVTFTGFDNADAAGTTVYLVEQTGDSTYALLGQATVVTNTGVFAGAANNTAVTVTLPPGTYNFPATGEADDIFFVNSAGTEIDGNFLSFNH